MTLPRSERAAFLEPSPYEADAGNLIGRDPRQIPLAEIRRLEHLESPIRAIRAKCLDCVGSNAAEVRKCVAVNCALWPFRMAVSPFHASSASARRELAKFATPSETEGHPQEAEGPASAATDPDHGSTNSSKETI